jgi:hypothetical protein
VTATLVALIPRPYGQPLIKAPLYETRHCWASPLQEREPNDFFMNRRE